MIINTFKSFFDNVLVCYKSFLYKLIVWVIIIALAAAIFLPNLLPIFDDLTELGVFDLIKTTLEKLPSFSMLRDEIVNDLKNVNALIQTVLSYHSANLIISYIGFGFLIILEYFLTRLSDVAVGSLLYGSMQYRAKFSFPSEYLSKIVLSLKYTLLYMAIFVPIDGAITALSLFILFGIGGGFVYFAPSAAMLVFIMLFSLRLTLCVAWMPAVIAEEGGTIAGLKKNFVIVKQRFAKTYAECLLALILAICLIVTVTICTLGVGLPIVLTALPVFFACYKYVVYFEIQGIGYYVDCKTVITPNTTERKGLEFHFELHD